MLIKVVFPPTRNLFRCPWPPFWVGAHLIPLLSPSLMRPLRRPAGCILPVTGEMELFVVPSMNLSIRDSVISGFVTDEGRNGQPPPRAAWRRGRTPPLQAARPTPPRCSLPPVTYLPAMAGDNCGAGNWEGRENTKEPHSPALGLWRSGERQRGHGGVPLDGSVASTGRGAGSHAGAW